MWLASLTAVGVAGYAASTLLPIRGIHDWVARGAVFRAPPESIALTFDDGPHPERTPRILDLLAQSAAKATFFLIGAQAEKHPDIARRIADEGHGIGNHSWSHPWLPGLSSRRIEDELTRCQDTLSAVTGKRPSLVRPPYGSRDFRFYRIASTLGLTPALWSRDTLDWAGAGPELIRKRLDGAAAGDILLLHDGSPRATGTADALSQWLGSSTPGGRLAALPEGTRAAKGSG